MVPALETRPAWASIVPARSTRKHTARGAELIYQRAIDRDRVGLSGYDGPRFDPQGFACVRVDAGDGSARLALSGELDVATTAELDRALRDAQQRADLVTLDLRRLTFMDCQGLAVLISAATRARESGDRFRVVRGPPCIDRLFELAGADRCLEFA